MASDDNKLLPDEDSQLRAVEQLLADDAPAAAQIAQRAAATTPAAGTDMDAGPNPMVMVAKAMLEAQGPVPSYADFAAVPSGNPFSNAAAPSEAQPR